MVYNGQLDLICCTLGVDSYLDKLRWPGLAEFSTLRPEPFQHPHKSRTAGFMKRHKNLQMVTILDAGHMVPADQPAVALHMVRELLTGLTTTLNLSGLLGRQEGRQREV